MMYPESEWSRVLCTVRSPATIAQALDHFFLNHSIRFGISGEDRRHEICRPETGETHGKTTESRADCRGTETL